MSRIVVFGAGGRAGRAAVGEARQRGHQVTAVVRDPAKYGDLATDGVHLVAGDVTDVDSVARIGEGHDAAAGDFDHGGVRTGRYRTAAADAASRISYADFAIALLDEIDTPKHHHVHLGVEAG